MPDTGAPWNIPYQEPADIVRDYPAASEDLADAIAAGLTAAGSPGIGSNVVSVAKTNVFTTSSTPFVDVTDLSVTITPTTATSKILLIAQVTWGYSGNTGDGFYFRFAGGNSGDYIGDAAGSRIRATFGGITNGTSAELNGVVRAYVMSFLDSPATASAVTYKVQAGSGSGFPVSVNKSFVDTNNAQTSRAASSITAIEVAV